MNITAGYLNLHVKFITGIVLLTLLVLSAVTSEVTNQDTLLTCYLHSFSWLQLLYTLHFSPHTKTSATFVTTSAMQLCPLLKNPLLNMN